MSKKKTKKPTTPRAIQRRMATLIAKQNAVVSVWAKAAIKAATQLRIKSKPIREFSLTKEERQVLAMLSALDEKLRRKVSKANATFRATEIADMAKAISESFADAERSLQGALVALARKIMTFLTERITSAAPPDLRPKVKPKNR